MRLHDRFEWNENKARESFRKHGVSFTDAAIALADEHGDFFHLEKYDDDHSLHEDRWSTIASRPDEREIVLEIVWTERMSFDGCFTRIISARFATASERSEYEDYVAHK